VLRVHEKGSDQTSYVKVSNWFILINSNVSDDGRWETVDRVQNILLRTKDKLFGTPSRPTTHFNEIFKSGAFGKGKGAGKNRVLQPYMSKIDGVQPKIDVNSKTEIGTKKKRIHLHMDVAVQHYGSLMIDYKEFHRLVRKYISEDPENCTEEEGCLITNPFISIKHYQSRMGAEAYLNKGNKFNLGSLREDLFSEELIDNLDKRLLGAMGELNISTRPSEI